jgi:hypothetical protein
MKSREFEAKAGAIFGAHGWKKRIAAATGKDYATVKRWATGELPVPDYAVAIVELLEIVPEAMRPERFLRPARRIPTTRRAVSKK